ncbi:Uncharacterised protein [Bordetella pertussis]|nr:Uncharacterised protein [Bordetella pertussis]
MPGMTATQASLRPPPRLGADTAAVLRRHGASPPSADATP